DYDLDVRVALLQLGRRGQAVHARHLDVQHGHVGLGGLGGLQYLVAAAYLRHHFDVTLEREQRGQRLPDHHLIFGEEQPDGLGLGHSWELSGTVATRRKPWPGPFDPEASAGPSDRRPPMADRRSDTPRSPLP